MLWRHALPAGMIFLFVAAFDPWPTEARAADAASCGAGSAGPQAQAWISADRPNSLASLAARTQPSTRTVRLWAKSPRI